jgi:hypothetical protein
MTDDQAEEVRIANAHRQWQSQARGQQNHRKTLVTIREIWKAGDFQLTVYTPIEGGEIPNATYQAAWHEAHPDARKLTT